MRFRFCRFLTYSLLLCIFLCFLWHSGKPSTKTSLSATTTMKPIKIPLLYENYTVFNPSNPEKFKCAAELLKTQPPFPALLIDVDFLREISSEGCHIPGAIKVAVSLNLVDSITRIDNRRHNFEIMFYENSTNMDYIKLFGRETRAIPHFPVVSFGNWTMPKEISLFTEYWRRSLFQDCLAININRKDAKEVLPVMDTVKALSDLRKLLVPLGMFPFLIAGTFLGWYRECGLIPHTRDADFAVVYEQHNPLLLKLLLAKQTKFEILRTVGLVEDNYEITVIPRGKCGPKIDIFFMYTNGVNESWIGATEPTGEKFSFFYPMYDPYCSADLFGHHYWVTCSPQEKAEFVYGSNFTEDSPTSNYNSLNQLNWRKAGKFENEKDAMTYYRSEPTCSSPIISKSCTLLSILLFVVY